MVTQKLYIGDYYLTDKKLSCLFGKKLLVVGHQKHATEAERANYSSLEDFSDPCDDQNTIRALINAEWKLWKPNDRKSFLQFGRMMTGDRSMPMDKMVDLWKSIAFCNYLQVPDFNLPQRQGNDESILYENAKSVFLDKLLSAKPDKVIVWGSNPSYSCIKSALGVKTANKEFQFCLNGQRIDFLNMGHPCRLPKGGYDTIIPIIKAFLEK